MLVLALGLVFVSCDNGTTPNDIPPSDGTGGGDGSGDGDGGKTPGDGSGGGSIVGEWKVNFMYTEGTVTVPYALYIIFTNENKWGFHADLADAIITDWGFGEYGVYEYDPATTVLTLTNTITDDSDGSFEGPVEGKATVSGDVLIISDLPKIYESKLGPEMLNRTYTRIDRTPPIDDNDNGSIIGEWKRPYSYMGMLHYELYLTFTADTWKWEIKGETEEPPKDGQYTYNPSTKDIVLTGEDEGQTLELKGKAAASNDGQTLTISGLTENGKPAEDPGPGMINGVWSPR